MTEAEELQKLKDNSPYALSINPSEDGWTAPQIKEKFWKGLIVLYDFIKGDRASLEEWKTEITTALGVINAATHVMARAAADEDGSNIKQTYAKITEIQNGLIATLKYIKTNGQTANISDLEREIASVDTSLSTFIASYFNGEKAKKAVTADSAETAVKDSAGRVIKDTYALASNYSILQGLVEAIENGTSVVDKARKDQDGNRIDQTYVKISNIVNALDDTSTTKPLSAAQGKALKDALDTLSNYIYNGASNTSIDRLAEVFAFLTNHDDDETLDAVLALKVSKSDIVDNLTTEATDKPLSAKQGKVLKGQIDTKANSSDVYTKSAAEDMVDAKIGGISSVNVITDQDEEKVFDWKLVVRGGKVYLGVDDISETN